MIDVWHVVGVKLMVDLISRKLWRFCYYLARNPDMADDLVQEAWTNWYEHRPDQGCFPTLAWLKRNAFFRFHDALRKRVDVPFNEEHESSFGKQPDESLADVEVREAIWREVKRLPTKYSAVIIKRYKDGQSITEIAKDLGVPEPTVSTQKNRALKMLRKRFGELSQN